MARGAFQGLRKIWRSSASRIHPEPRPSGDLGGRSGIEGGHGLGSAPSAALGGMLFGNSNFWDEQTDP